jgi:hypothetical protein
VNPSDISVTCAGKVCPTDDASTFFDLFSSGYVDIVPATGSGTFSFTSLDASFIGMAGVDYPLTAGAIQVFGFNPGANPVTEQFNLAGPSNGQTSFQTFTASSDFASQQFAEIAVVGFLCDASGECTGLDNNGGEYALDNIMLSDQPVSNVPEPATAALLAAGLLGFGVRKRKRA